MRWKITIEGMDECDGRDTAEIVIEKEFDRLSKGEIGLSISDGKTIMACLQQLAVNGRRGEVVIGEERLSPGRCREGLELSETFLRRGHQAQGVNRRQRVTPLENANSATCRADWRRYPTPNNTLGLSPRLH